MDEANSKRQEYKDRVRAEWAGDETAAAWQKHYPNMKEQLAQVTQAFVTAAAPRPGMVVLDLASGTGEPAIPLAKAVGPTGRVVASDLSEAMLAALRHNAEEAGVSNLETRACDAADLPFPDASFDLVTSRFGIMFVVDTARALAELRRVLKPGGRVALLVWGAPGPRTMFGESVVPFMRRLPEKPDPDAPGPMRFAEPGKLSRALTEAGFHSVEETSRTYPAPVRGTPEELLSSLMELAAPFRNALARLPEAERLAAESEALGGLRKLYDGTFTQITAPVIIVTAARG